MRRLNRADRLLLPASAYTTYQIAAPVATHWRRATCAEVDCPAYLRGWRTTLDPDDAQRLAYIRHQSGRRFTEHRSDGGLVVFEFDAGQRCFTQHQQPLEREPLYLRRGGDWRGNPIGDQVLHRRAADWVDDFATHQQRIADRINQG